MRKLKLILSSLIGKSILFVLKILGKGSGTALPGLVVEKFFPNILLEYASQIPNIILITGTNGKTTTQQFLTEILKVSHINFIANKTGSNMKRGLISQFIKNSNFLGKIDAEFGIFEIEEATLPRIISQLNPKVLIVTNLFRDQLDAYGEIDRTQKFIRQAIEQVGNLKIILNADDRLVYELKAVNKQNYFYGIDEYFHNKFKFEKKHVGEIQENVFRAFNLKVNEDLSTEFYLENNNFRIQIPGIYQVYNALAAIQTSIILNLDPSNIKTGIEQAHPAFGRGEDVTFDSNKYKLLLVKNPAGLNLTLDLLLNIHAPNLIFILNDNLADGRDVSWIWDGNFELLQNIKPKNIICSGQRVGDILLRVKYVLGPLKKISENLYESEEYGTKVYFVEHLENIPELVNEINVEKIWYTLPTYTAMLDFRKVLTGSKLN